MQEVQQEIRDLRQQQVQQISNLLEELAALRGRLAAQQTALADLADRGRTQADNLKRLAGEMEALEASVHSLADSSVALRNEMAALHGKVVASNSGDEQLAARFQQLQAGLEKPRLKKKPAQCFFFVGFLGFFLVFLYICPEERVFRVFSISRILLGASRL